MLGRQKGEMFSTYSKKKQGQPLRRIYTTEVST